MTTITVWLLISVGQFGHNAYTAANASLGQFPTAQECARVLSVIAASTPKEKPVMRCIEATVVAGGKQ